MWNEQKTFLTSQLSSGESLLWSGQPRQGSIFRIADVYFLFMIGFGLLWATLVLRTGGFPQFVALFAVPNILWGLYGISGRYFVDSKRRAKTYYGVTNERIIIVSGLFNKQVKSLPLKTIPELSLDEKANGTGTITFGPEESESWFSKYFMQKEQIVYPSFEQVQDAKRVYETIRSAQKARA